MKKKSVAFLLVVVLVLPIVAGVGFYMIDRSKNKSSGLVNSGIDYTESTAQLRNPARGVSIEPSLTDVIANGNLTQINVWNTHQYTTQLFTMNLNQWRYSPISETALTNLDAAFAEARRLEITVYIRFAYHGHYPCDCIDHCKDEPALQTMFEHVDQLMPILAKYPDVLLYIRCGMIGPWGEEHSTPLARPSPDGGPSGVVLLIQKWLDSTKEHGLPDVQIVTRTMRHYLNWYNYRYDTNYIQSSINYTSHAPGTEAYRVGIYNDVYMLDNTDMGTFQDRDNDMEWLNKKASYTFYGGEPGGGTKPWAGEQAFVEPAAYKTRATHIRDGTSMSDQWRWMTYNGPNPVYNNTAITSVGYNWEYIQTRPTRVLDWLNRHLGYRFVVRESLMSKRIKPGGKMQLKGTIENVGFAPILVKTKASIIIADGNTNVYEQPVIINLNSGKYNVTIDVPPALDAGQYTVYLKVWRDKSGTPNDTQNETIAFANNGEFTHGVRHHWDASRFYLTNNNVMYNVDPAIKANKIADFSVGDAGFSLNKKGTHSFPTVAVGYDAQTPLTVTVKNTSSETIDDLTVSCADIASTDNRTFYHTGTDTYYRRENVPPKFTISKTAIESIAKGEKDTFTVVPDIGTPAGTYTARISVTNSTGFVVSFNVKFTVVLSAVTSVTMNNTTYITLKRGDTYQFKAPTVNGAGKPSQAVTWSIERNSAIVSETGLGDTNIDSKGLLTIDPNMQFSWSRTNCWTIKVHARSTADNTKVATVAIKIWYNSISVNHGGSHTFARAKVGYGTAPPAYTVTITHTGLSRIGLYSPGHIALSGMNPDCFELSETDFSNLMPGSTFEFTVQPKAGLSPGTYTAIVSVWGQAGAQTSGSMTHTASSAADISAHRNTFTVSFTVTS